MKRRWGILAFGTLLVTMAAGLAAWRTRQPDADAFRERARAFTEQLEARGLAEPFKGITTGGEIVPGLFRIRATGVSTAPVREAAERFIATLTPGQRAGTLFPVDDVEWRRWANQHSYLREGLAFESMSETQREAALAMLRASLSAKGLTLTRDIMRLNHTLAELTNNFVEYGEGKYWITIMGEPSATQPWGWQLDGHHLVVNYFVLADQVVMTPSFWGSEPTVAHSGKYAGTEVLADEQRQGLALVRALDESQRKQAILEVTKTGNNILAQAFSDNLVLDYAGIRVSAFTAAQRTLLMDLIGLFVSNMREGHAKIRLSEVAAHLDDTWFAWIGGVEDDSVYYYRIHSPVILIEFDHQRPIALRHLHPPDVPNRQHVHAVVRTPNGNDYGKDLLRQHYERHEHPH